MLVSDVERHGTAESGMDPRVTDPLYGASDSPGPRHAPARRALIDVGAGERELERTV